ncbi:eukaryotic translation initiation factor 4E-like, partial [Tropilaelaps mercedesae]
SDLADTVDDDDDDDAVVPDLPCKVEHEGSDDTLDHDQETDLTKETLAPEPQYSPTLTEATQLSKDFDTDKDQLAEKPEKTNSLTKTLPAADVKHPLQDIWVFWYYQGDKKKSWYENLLQLWEFDTAEDFWAIYNHTIPPSNLQPGRDFNLFKKGIRPEWEDVNNIEGGIWSITLRERRMRSPEMDAVWTEVAMLLIGHQFDHLAAFVNGATYSARKNQDRVSLWVRANLDEHRGEVQAIGERLRKAVHFAGNNFILEYATSQDWKNKAGSTVNARMILHMQ